MSYTYPQFLFDVSPVLCCCLRDWLCMQTGGLQQGGDRCGRAVHRTEPVHHLTEVRLAAAAATQQLLTDHDQLMHASFVVCGVVLDWT